MTDIICIRKENSIDFVSHLFAAYRDRTPVVLLDQGASASEIPGFATGNVVEPKPGGGWFSEKVAQWNTTNPAQIVYTSGTEGEAKAIVLSHRALADAVKRLNEAMRVDASIREYVGIPVTYSFGLGRCRAVAAAGGKFYLPENGFDPIEIRDMLKAGEINSISAVPTLMRLILNDPAILDGAGASVKWLELGSQYMSREEKEALKRLFPNATILQHYGLTEASRSTFLLISETSGRALESVGRPFGDVEVRTSESGRIQIRGPHVAIGRISQGAIVPLVDAQGWLTTGDNGHFEDGNLFFDGRADDLINSGGIKVDPGLLEREVLAELGVESGIAIARIPDPARGEGFFAGVEEGLTLDLQGVEQAVRTCLKRRGIVAGSSVKVQAIPAIPCTGTGKVRRSELASLYRPEPEPAKVEYARDGGVLALYRHMFNRADIPETASFQDLGGDSLNYVEMSIALERELGAIPRDWDIMPACELAKLRRSENGRLNTIESSIFLRALAITCVVATHSGMHILGGGTFLLFFLIGYNLARFKYSALTKGNILGPLVNYTLVLLVPYAILSVLYMGFNRVFYPDLVFLYTNLHQLRLTQIFPFWFVQVLVQCLIVTGGLFLIPEVRKIAARKPWPFALTAALAFICVWIVAYHVWNTDYLRNLVPQRYLALLWIGWCCYFADTPRRRVIALILGLGFAFIDSGISRNSAWIAIGPVTLLFMPMIRVPGIFRNGIQIVSAATFYIFALNGILAWILTSASNRLLGFSPSLPIFILTFTGCIVGSWIIERMVEYAQQFRLRRGLQTT